MSKKYIPTKRTNPCPACGDTKGKCRTFSDSPLLLCMESAGGTQRVGWINTGDTKDGLWGKLIPDDEQTRGKSWQEQQEERARKIERDRAEEREKLKHALPIEDRSPEFRKLLLQLEIKPEDNQDLINRGLSPEDIKRLLIKSVEPKQEVKGIKPNLPGIYNDRISVSDSGYLCPAFDEFGRIVGCQLRIRDAEDNKYRWLKGKFPSNLLVNGNKELPLTVLKGDSEDAYLCEGILKPAIANVVHNKTFIGASGGNFTNSPEQLKRILKAVAKDGKVYFCPDAGFNLNPQVQRRDRATIKLVQSLGYEVYILDWGQLNDKSIGDVDEISSEVLDSAIAIPASEFFKSPEQKLWEEEKKAQAQREEEEHGKTVSPEKGKRDRAVGAIKGALDDIKQTAIDFLNREDVKAQRQDPVILVPVKNDEGSDRNYEAGKIEEPRGPVVYGEWQRQQVWSEANAKGYKIILDRSATGQGKSYTASQLKLTNFDFGGEEGNGQLILFLGEPDNPSVPLDEWHRIPTLNENNCHKWEERRALAAKGLGRSSGKGKHDSNPICNSCPFLSKCREGSGDGYGFKSQMQEALAVAKAYGHPAGFPRQKNDGAIAIYDEFESLIKPTKTRSISLKQLSRIFLALEQRDYVKEAMGEGDSLYSDLIFIKEYLEPYLSGAKETPRYGIDLAEMQKIRPDWDEEKISQIISLVDEFEGELAKNNLKSLNADSSSEDIDRIVDMPFLGDLIAILMGDNSGALRVWHEKLLITTPNTDAIAQVKSFKTSILLDATCTKQDLVRWYGFKPEEILECRQERTPTPKFKIIQLTGAGLNTSQRSEAGHKRKQTIIAELNKVYGNGGLNKIGVIDYKAHADEGDLHHFRSGEEGARGSNRFQNLHAIAAIGCPYIAVNAILDEYQAISGEVVAGDRAQEDEGFTQYYESKIQKEIIQEVGRLRANLRPETPLTFFLINDINPKFLTELGVEVVSQPVWHTVESLRPRSIQKLEGLASFFAELASSGLHLSQAKMKDAADSLKVANSDLSRLTKKVGGWFSLREKINNLFKETKEAVNFSHWQWEEFIKTKLGELYSIDLLDSPKKLCAAIEQHGWQAFSEYFSALDTGSKATAIANLLYIILGDRGEWITNLKDFCLEELGLSESQIGLSPPLE